MAVDSNKFPAWFIIFICVSTCVPLASAQCTDGTYEHDGRDCCLCGAGSSLNEHCITSQSYGKCEPCAAGTYSSHPTSHTSCLLCTSCAHPNDNREEAEACTPARDTKCRCKEDHYCATEICNVCHPCTKCGEEGIKVRCAERNDTVCNEKTEGGSLVGAIVAIIVAIAVILAVVAGVCYFRKKKKNQEMTQRQDNGNLSDVTTRLIKDVDLGPHLVDIAEIIRWKDMKIIAMRSNMLAAVEACEENFPNNVEERTIELLKRWVEREGQGASQKLVEALRKSGNNAKADQVHAILSSGSTPPV